MKSKTLTWVLGLAVVAVWGIIITKVLDASSAGDDTAGNYEAGNLPVKEPEANYTLCDTFTLALNYRDPFTGTAIQPRVQAVTTAPQPVKTAAPRKSPLSNLPVSYKGYVFNPSLKRMVSVILFNNKERMMQEGETTDGLKLLKNMKDSVSVTYLGETKVIRLN